MAYISPPEEIRAIKTLSSDSFKKKTRKVKKLEKTLLLRTWFIARRIRVKQKW